MAQRPKDEVRDRIQAAALEIFAAKGFRKAAVADVAAAAGVSTGNLYRYHGGKRALFEAVVPDAFVRDLSDRLHRRVDALAGVADVRTLPSDAPFFAASADLLDFCVANRLRVAIVLGRAQGTRHEGFGEALAEDLAKRAVAHFAALRPGDPPPPPAARFVLRRIYRNLVDTMVEVLLRHSDGGRIRLAVQAYSRFHLAGLAAFFDREGTP